MDWPKHDTTTTGGFVLEEGPMGSCKSLVLTRMRWRVVTSVVTSFVCLGEGGGLPRGVDGVTG